MFFLKDQATTEIYTYSHPLSLHDALPIYVPLLTLAENIALPRATGLLLDAEADRVAADAAIARLAIKAPGADALPGELSGGNAQKVVIAKWLAPTTRVLQIGRASCRDRVCQSVWISVVAGA